MLQNLLRGFYDLPPLDLWVTPNSRLHPAQRQDSMVKSQPQFRLKRSNWLPKPLMRVTQPEEATSGLDHWCQATGAL